jgi:hypothetical protein
MLLDEQDVFPTAITKSTTNSGGLKTALDELTLISVKLMTRGNSRDR